MNIAAYIVCLLVGAAVGFWGRGADWNAVWARLKSSPGKASAALQWFSQLAGLVALFILVAPQFKGCDWDWPTPPGPGPAPAPIPPKPSPAPIPVAGLRVLVIDESADRPKLPKEQLAMIYGQELRDYLNAKCVVGPDGKTKEWRIFDKDVQGAEKIWTDALARPRTSLPWLIVSNGKTGYEGPLPKSLEETLKIIKLHE